MTETIRESFLFENPRSGDGIGSWFKDKVAGICRNQIELMIHYTDFCNSLNKNYVSLQGSAPRLRPE